MRDVRELLQVLGVQVHLDDRGPIALPLRFFVGEPREDAIDLETPSAMEIIKAAGAGIELPGTHLAHGLAQATGETVTPFIAIHSSRDRPSHAAVAVMHKGWWFFVDERELILRGVKTIERLPSRLVACCGGGRGGVGLRIER